METSLNAGNFRVLHSFIMEAGSEVGVRVRRAGDGDSATCLGVGFLSLIVLPW